MNFLARSLSRTLKSSLHSRTPTVVITGRKWVLSQHFHSTTTTDSSSKSGAIKPKPSPSPAPPVAAEALERPRPSEIPYQPKVANSVNLIGYVDQPVQFEASTDGKFWAGTVVSQRTSSGSGSGSGSGSNSNSNSNSSANLWIPIIFEGDLAHTAAFHLKKNDRIHISGQLFVDSPPSNVSHGQAHVQVMVQTLHFIQSSSPVKEDLATSDGKEGVLKHSASIKKDRDDTMDSWHHLLEKPEEWWDYRENKQNGLVNPRHPDFKKKEGSVALWLNTAPSAVLSDLEGVKFDVPVSKSRPANQHKGDESWKNLIENPDKWWDNREDKKNSKSPDFKHKESGVGLWLSDSPAWVLPKLPPPRSKPRS